jgi:hypothetical protein
MPVVDPVIPKERERNVAPVDVKDEEEREKVLEVCIALSALPQDALTLQEMSHKISAYTASELKAATLVQLGRSDRRLSVAPHLTLYQCSLPVRNIYKACLELDRYVLLCMCVWPACVSSMCLWQGASGVKI